MKLNHPPGAICIASGELARYPHFTHAMLHVLRPHGTTIEMHCGLNVAANFNAGIRRMLADPRLEWVWIMGDDHEFHQSILLQLLDAEKDIIVPIVVRRQPPFIPVLFKRPVPGTPAGQFPPFHWDELPPTGLLGPEHGLYVAGSAGMLIRRRVLEALQDPWFEVGMAGIDLMNEDVHFCQKAQDAGFPIYAHLDVPMDHWTPMSFRPIKSDDNQWTVAINLGSELQVALPPDFLYGLMHKIREEGPPRHAIDPMRPEPAHLTKE